MTDSINQEKLEAERREMEALARDLAERVRDAYAYNPKTGCHTLKLNEDQEPTKDFEGALRTALGPNAGNGNDVIFDARGLLPKHQDVVESLDRSIGERLKELGFKGQHFEYLASGQSKIILMARHEDGDVCRIVIGLQPYPDRWSKPVYVPTLQLAPFHRERFNSEASGVGRDVELTIAPMLYTLTEKDSEKYDSRVGEIMALGVKAHNGLMESGSGYYSHLTIQDGHIGNIALAPLENPDAPTDPKRLRKTPLSITPIFVDEGSLLENETHYKFITNKGKDPENFFGFQYFPEHAKYLDSMRDEKNTMATFPKDEYKKENDMGRFLVPNFCWMAEDGTASVLHYFRPPPSLIPEGEWGTKARDRISVMNDVTGELMVKPQGSDLIIREHSFRHSSVDKRLDIKSYMEARKSTFPDIFGTWAEAAHARKAADVGENKPKSR